jgi:hypothetical protein
MLFRSPDGMKTVVTPIDEHAIVGSDYLSDPNASFAGRFRAALSGGKVARLVPVEVPAAGIERSVDFQLAQHDDAPLLAGLGEAAIEAV